MGYCRGTAWRIEVSDRRFANPTVLQFKSAAFWPEDFPPEIAEDPGRVGSVDASVVSGQARSDVGASSGQAGAGVRPQLPLFGCLSFARMLTDPTPLWLME